MRWLLVTAILLGATPTAAQPLFTYTDESGHVTIVDDLGKIPKRYLKQIPREKVERWNEERRPEREADSGTSAKSAPPPPERRGRGRGRDSEPDLDRDSDGDLSHGLPAAGEATEAEDSGLLSDESRSFLQNHFGAPKNMVRMPEDPIGEPGLAGFLNDQFRPAGLLLLSDTERREVDTLEARWRWPLLLLIAIGILLLVIYWAHAALTTHLGLMAFCTFWSLVGGNVIGIVIGSVWLGGLVGTAVGLAPIVFYTWRYVRNLTLRYALLAVLLLTNATGLWMAVDADRTIGPLMQTRSVAGAG